MAQFQYNDIRTMPKTRRQPESTRYYKYPLSQHRALLEHTERVYGIISDAITQGGQRGQELLEVLNTDLRKIRPKEKGWARTERYLSESYSDGIWYHTPWTVIEELYNHIRTDQKKDDPSKGKKDLTVNMVEKWNRLYGSDPKLAIEMVPSLRATPANSFNKLFTAEETN